MRQVVATERWAMPVSLRPMQLQRPTCYQCFRPHAVCICSALVRVENQTRITIVQHPRERFHPLNTAKLVEGSLSHARVLRGDVAELHRILTAGAIGPEAWLLYPAADAVDLSSLPRAETPQEIVVLDGTWHQASTLLRDLPVLRSLRSVRFIPTAPSEYLIRKEPRADYLSTLESIAHVLEVLEPETAGLETLRSSFRLMVQKNIKARRPSADGRRFSRRKRGYAFPERLTTEQPCHTLIYAEGAHLVDSDAGRQPLVVSMLDPQTRHSERVLLKPPGPVRPRLLEELHLGPSDLDRGVHPAEARTTLCSALGGRTVVAWNASTFGLLDDLGLSPDSRLFLKGIYCDWRRSLGDRKQQWGSMGEILQRHQVSWEFCGGRAERRLAQTAALYRFLQFQARRHARELS